MDLTVLSQALAAAGATGGANPNAWNISEAYYDVGADAWDISKAFYSGVTFSVSGQTSAPQSVFFKPDGTKMYVIGGPQDVINEYTLSTAWLVSTASYVQNFSVATEESSPRDAFFKPDGTKMYIVGDGGDEVNEYDLATAWNISTASHVQSFSVAAQETIPNALFFKPDGTKMFVLGSASDDVIEYSLSSAWDISTASFVQDKGVTGQETLPTALFFKPDGTKMYVAGETGDDVNEYSLSSAWDISTASFVQVFSFSAQETVAQGLFFHPDGIGFYVIGESADSVRQYTIGGFSVAAQETLPRGLFFKPDGTKMYISGSDGDEVNEYDLSTVWDITTASYLQTFSVASQDTTPRGLFFKPDGTKMYVVGGGGQDINEYDLSSAWDISTSSFLQNFSVGGQDTAPTGIFFRSDGIKMYIAGDTGDDINEYDLSTPWDVSTASFLQNFSVASQEPNPTGLYFKDDGTKMYVVGVTNDLLNEYALSTAWDISSASYVTSFSVRVQAAAAEAVFFKPDGAQFWILDRSADKVFSYLISPT